MISIIMPVYNTEKYLREAVDSIIGQSLSFRDNVILYLLDDASTDNSLSICYDYEKEYPDNIRVVHFDSNQGVSAVRNYGVRECRNHKDTIVGFVDSDDKLDKDTLKRVTLFFAQHEEVSIAVSEVRYFDARESEHKLNWRFQERDVVNIRKDFMFPQYFIGGTFLRKKALRNIHFDEEMSFWEDALALNKVILVEGKYGLVQGAIYFYRKRADESSLVDRAWHDKERYDSFLENGYMCLMNFCRKKKFRILPYIQYLIAYHLRLFMLRSNTDIIQEMLDEQELISFKKRLEKVLRRIDETIIIQLSATSLPVIEAMLSIRNGKKVRARRTYTEDDCIFSYRGHEIKRMSECNVRLFHVVEKPGKYEGMWRGRFSTPVFQMAKEDYIFAVNNGVRVNSICYPSKKKIYILGEIMRNYKYAGFMIPIPPEWKSAHFGIHTNGIDIMLNEIVFEELN